MPPGPVFNWLAVASSVADIFSHAAQIKAAQAASRTAPLLSRTARDDVEGKRKKRKIDAVLDAEEADKAVLKAGVKREGLERAGAERNMESKVDLSSAHFVDTFGIVESSSLRETPPHDDAVQEPRASTSSSVSVGVHASMDTAPSESVTGPEALGTLPESGAPTIISELPTAASPSTGAPPPAPADILLSRRRHVQLESSKVPSSRIGRLFHYGGLAASLSYGAAAELVRRSASSSNDGQSSPLMLTEANVKRLVSKLTKMRGAALKLGQFMSIQDSHVLPPQVEDIFRRVQDGANYMPDWQMEEVMRSSVGPTWHDSFTQFDRIPFAAASIGQVHSAVLSASVSPTGKEEKVAVKIQFPNIVNSIESDLGYVKMLLTTGRLLPKGLFLDRTIEVMKGELADECNYSREASFLRKFGDSAHLGDDLRFKVPWVWDGSTERVLVMEHVDGVSVGGSVIDTLSQQDKDDIAARIIELCLKELFTFRIMQTDPNWTNFLWNSQTRQVSLVDFGASREYSKPFIDNWLRLLQAASSDDHDLCVHWSLKVGYLTGAENQAMLDAHVKSLMLLATPFKQGTVQPFAFGTGSAWARATAEIREQIPVMLQHRLTPPPRETYSLNRKLSGAFLLAARLDARVDCRQLWEDVMRDYQFKDAEF